jgi:hypothetical protein
MNRDDYICGGHHFWVHFWCGSILGAGLGASFGWGLFDSHWEFVASTAVIALIAALCCGRWGDSAWEWIIGLLRRF